MLTLMRVEAYEPPTWPNGPQFQQMHLDLAAEDLDADVAAAVELGARPPTWRVRRAPVSGARAAAPSLGGC